MEKTEKVKDLLENYSDMRDFGNSNKWRFVEKVLFHELYLIGFLDKPYLSKEEEYRYYDMGEPDLRGLIRTRLQNKTFRCIDDDYLEN